MTDQTLQEQLDTIELSTEQAKEKVALKTSLELLRKNKHFKKVFGEYYLDSYASRLVQFKAHPSQQSKETQQFIADQLNAIGHMHQFMNYVFMEGANAEKLIEANNGEADILRSEHGAS